MVRIEAKYENGLRCIATHIPSGKQIITDAPIDNHGKGESFSPTDLLATSMLTCIMTIIGIRAEKKKIDVNGMSGSVEKSMTTNPRRVGKLEIIIKLPSNLDLKELIENQKPDLVNISLPNEHHYEMTMKVIKSNCHLFVEKPLVFSINEANNLIKEAEKRKLFFGINLIGRNISEQEIKSRKHYDEFVKSLNLMQ